MKIKTKGKELVEALELVSLKGKYHNGLTAKNGQLSNFAYAEIDDDVLFIYNADHSTVCKIGVDLIEHENTKIYPNINKAKTKLKWRPNVTFEKGVKIIINSLK